MASVDEFVWPVGTKHTWEGNWAGSGDEQGFEYSFELVLTRAESTVDGFLKYTLLSTPDDCDWLQDKIGQSAKEFVGGSYDSAAKKIALSGHTVSDPNLIACDSYRLTIKPDLSFDGQTRTDKGDWSGRIQGCMKAKQKKTSLEPGFDGLFNSLSS